MHEALSSCRPRFLVLTSFERWKRVGFELLAFTGEAMSRGKSIVAYVILACVGCVGARLVGLFEDAATPPRSTSESESLLALLGFILLMGVIIGTVLVVRQSMRPWGDRDVTDWQMLRALGKHTYIRQSVLKGTLFGLLAIALALISDYLKLRSFGLMVNSLWAYGSVLLIFIFGAYYGALRTWSANEREYTSLVQSKPFEGE